MLDNEGSYGQGQFALEAVGQVYKQTAKFVYLGSTVCENADIRVELNRCVLRANPRLRRHGLPLATVRLLHRTALWLKVRMLNTEATETMLYGCVTRGFTVADLAILRTVHRPALLHCIGSKRKHRDGYHMLSHADALAKNGCENVEAKVQK